MSPSTDEAPIRKRRRPWAAFLFSVFNPGLGHLYAGYWKRGLIWYAALMSASIVGLWTLIQSPQTGIFVFLFAALVMPVLVGIDGYRLAKRVGEAELKRFQRWYVYVAYCVVSLVLILPSFQAACATYIAESFVATDDLMSPTLREGDTFLLVRPLLGGREYHRGEIVVFFAAPDKNATEDTIETRRVVGLPGELIELKENRIFVNGKLLCERYARWNGDRNAGPITVPADSVLALNDSRTPKGAEWLRSALVPVRVLEGKARLIYWNSSGEATNIGKELLPAAPYPESCRDGEEEQPKITV